MSSNPSSATLPSRPRRPLHADFTAQTIHLTTIAKRRKSTRQQLKAFYKEPFSMKSLAFLRTAPGAALVLAILATTGVGAYALTNWFNANVTVTQHDSVLSVDLSQCEGNLPPGVEPTTADRHNVQFKVLGDPHISAQDLQQNLLGQCEASSITEFYGKLFPQAGLSSTGHPAHYTPESRKYALRPAVIDSINNSTITLRSTGTKSDSFANSTFTLAPNSTVYDAGKQVSVSNLKPGDTIMFLAYAPDAPDSTLEGTSVLDDPSISIVSLFKAQYNVASTFDYQSSNIMPLN